ncbi:MAG: PKD domain-containing protein [Deltaproteobacteria bacterium]|nr:PKD domain-containing protein [Deltaproteobacteria bacterium]
MSARSITSRAGVALALLGGAPLGPACGAGVHRKDDRGPPLFAFQAVLEAPVVDARQSPLGAAIVWGAAPSADDACLAELGVASPDYRCLPAFDFEPRAVSNDVAVRSTLPGILEIPVYGLPPAALLAGDAGGRFGYGALVLYEDANHDGVLGLGGDDADRVVATSIAGPDAVATFVAYQEGEPSSWWQLFAALGCPAPGPGFSLLQVHSNWRGGFACERVAATTVLRLANASGCGLTEADDCFTCAAGCPQVPRAQRICVAGQCGFSCDAGFADCNLQPADGCEAGSPSPSCRRRGPWGTDLTAILDVLEIPNDVTSFAFDASRSIARAGYALARYEFDFGDGSRPGGGPEFASPTATHTYGSPGGYNARVVVVDSDGRKSEDRQGVRVVSATAPGMRPPLVRARAILGAEASGAAPTLGVQLEADVELGAVPVGGVWWDFGDGAAALGALATHTFATPGVYQVQVGVVDDNGLEGTDRLSLVVGATDPRPAFTASAFAEVPAGEVPHATTLVCEAAGAAAAGYRWRAAGVAGVVEAQSVWYQWDAPGLFTATCTSWSADGQIAEAKVEVRVTHAGRLPPRLLLGDGVPATTACVGAAYAYGDDDRVAARGSRPLGFALAADTAGTAPPAGASIDAVSGRLVWVPTKAQVGRHNLRVEATNDVGTDALELEVLVADCGVESTPELDAAAGGCGCGLAAAPSALGVLGAVALVLWAGRRRLSANGGRGR